MGRQFGDFARLLEVLQELADAGNTVLVIELNLEVIKMADWVASSAPRTAPAADESLPPARPRASPRRRKS